MSSSESSEASSYDDASYNDQETTPENAPKQVVKTFSSRLLSELIDFTLRSLGSLPCSIVFVVLVFMIDTALRSSSAKLYFVCGYFIQLVFFYTFAVITFPKSAKRARSEKSTDGQEEGGDEGDIGSDFNEEDEEDESNTTSESAETKRMHDYLLQMVPFQQNTTASFYNFSVGYLLGYWGNINIQKNTRNATLVNSYYAAIVFFCFTFSVFYLKSCSWQSGIVSVAFGIVGGMVWSQVVMPRIQLDAAYDDKLLTDDVGLPGRGNSASAVNSALPHGVTACDGKNDDMVCRVFRTGG
jgi:hypothetical protein